MEKTEFDELMNELTIDSKQAGEKIETYRNTLKHLTIIPILIFLVSLYSVTPTLIIGGIVASILTFLVSFAILKKKMDNAHMDKVSSDLMKEMMIEDRFS